MNAVKSCVVIALLGAAGAAFAHGGGLNADGCHSDRKNGGYHCHRRAAAGGSTHVAGGDRSGFAPRQASGLQPSGGGAYRNCAAARAAGAAPVRRGDPGYGSHLDRDNDGIGCE